VCFAVDAVSEVQSIGITIVPAYPKIQAPKPTRHSTCVDVNGATEVSVGKLESVDLAMVEAEIADEQLVAEFAETWWRQGHSPRCGEVVPRNHLLNEIAVLIEDRDSSRTSSGMDLI
jgi:hypothetical protein